MAASAGKKSRSRPALRRACPKLQTTQHAAENPTAAPTAEGAMTTEFHGSTPAHPLPSARRRRARTDWQASRNVTASPVTATPFASSAQRTAARSGVHAARRRTTRLVFRPQRAWLVARPMRPAAVRQSWSLSERHRRPLAWALARSRMTRAAPFACLEMHPERNRAGSCVAKSPMHVKSRSSHGVASLARNLDRAESALPSCPFVPASPPVQPAAIEPARARSRAGTLFPQRSAAQACCHLSQQMFGRQSFVLPQAWTPAWVREFRCQQCASARSERDVRPLSFPRRTLAAPRRAPSLAPSPARSALPHQAVEISLSSRPAFSPAVPRPTVRIWAQLPVNPQRVLTQSPERRFSPPAERPPVPQTHVMGQIQDSASGMTEPRPATCCGRRAMRLPDSAEAVAGHLRSCHCRFRQGLRLAFHLDSARRSRVPLVLHRGP